MKSVSMQWAAQHANEINLIDVRTPGEFMMQNVPGAKNIPIAGLVNNHEHFLEKGKTYYIMCHSGGRSMMAIQHLEGKGYDLIQVEGGISAL